MAAKHRTSAGDIPEPRLMTVFLESPEIAVLVIPRFRVSAALRCHKWY